MLHQVTGDPQYQDWGWHIFRAFNNFSKVKSGGYINLDSVLLVHVSIHVGSLYVQQRMTLGIFSGSALGCAESACHAYGCDADLCIGQSEHNVVGQSDVLQMEQQT